ncbi:MAG: hypothetical protein ACTS3F_11670 [Phycisphaerales bacterium]
MKRSMHGVMIATLALPSIVVFATPRLGSMPGPSTAVASAPGDQPTDPALPAPARMRKLTDAQRRALDHRMTLDGQESINPFHYPRPEPGGPSPYEDSEPTEAPGESDAAPAVLPPTLTISAISAANGRAMAIVNGGLRHEGAALGDGWTIAHIDPASRSVTIRHETGAEHTATQGR